MCTLPNNDFLTQEEVDDLLQGIYESREAQSGTHRVKRNTLLNLMGFDAADIEEAIVYEHKHYGRNTMAENGTTVSEDGNLVEFSIKCGDWIFPAKDSISSVQYPIDTPLTLILYPTAGELHKPNLKRGDIPSHLNGYRRMHCRLAPKLQTLALVRLTNDAEPEWEQNVQGLSPFQFDYETLARNSQFNWQSNIKNNGEQMWAVFVTSVLLQHYLSDGLAKRDKWGNDKLYFRHATYPEIESIGRWASHDRNDDR